MGTITENHLFIHSIHYGAEEIKIDMLIKRFSLDRKQPSGRCYKLKVLYSIIPNLLKMNNPSLHIKSFFSRAVFLLCLSAHIPSSCAPVLLAVVAIIHCSPLSQHSHQLCTPISAKVPMYKKMRIHT